MIVFVILLQNVQHYILIYESVVHDGCDGACAYTTVDQSYIHTWEMSLTHRRFALLWFDF